MSARENLLSARCSPALFSKVLAARKIRVLLNGGSADRGTSGTCGTYNFWLKKENKNKNKNKRP